MAPRAVFFDIGDTLWRYPGDRPEYLLKHYEAARHLIVDAVDAPSTAEIVDAVSQRLAEQRGIFLNGSDRGTQPSTTSILADALSRVGLRPAPDRLARFTEAISAVEVDMAYMEPPEADMAAALEALRLRGLRLAAVSNTFMPESTLRAVLEVRGLLHFMEAVVSSADVGFRKPHPDCFRPALAQVGVEPGEAVFVGDHLNTDIEGALGLGMTAVLTHQYRQEDPEASPFKPHHVIRHLSELPSIVPAPSRYD